MTRDQADEYIQWLQDHRIPCPHCGRDVSAFLERCAHCSAFLPNPGKSSRAPGSIYQ